jgi:hypothetical protein
MNGAALPQAAQRCMALHGDGLLPLFSDQVLMRGLYATFIGALLKPRQ